MTEAMKDAGAGVIAVLVLMLLVFGPALWRAYRRKPCICPDARDCTCGGAWGGRR